MAESSESTKKVDDDKFFKLKKYIGKRVIVHTSYGYGISGLLREVGSEKTLTLTESIKVRADGSKEVLGKHTVSYDAISTVCLLASCKCDSAKPKN